MKGFNFDYKGERQQGLIVKVQVSEQQILGHEVKQRGNWSLVVWFCEINAFKYSLEISYLMGCWRLDEFAKQLWDVERSFREYDVRYNSTW